jgi:hypothetical protein
MDWYMDLPQNGKKVYDIIIRGVLLQHSSSWSHRADIGLSREPGRARNSAAPVVTIEEIGDLSTCAGLETIAGHGRRVSHPAISVEKTLPLKSLLDVLQLYYPTV